MDKIKWCVKKKEGLSLVERNSNLANAYFKKAEEALESMRINKSKIGKYPLHITQFIFPYIHS